MKSKHLAVDFRSRQTLFTVAYLQAWIALFLAVFTFSCGSRHKPQIAEARRKGSQTVTINNVEPRRDVTGQIIDAHDGCLQLFGPCFYLYGTAYGTNDGYTAANHYQVYRSSDLGQWTLVGELFKEQPTGVYYRPYVVFNPKTRKFVLWYNWYPKQWDGQTGVAISDTPTGPFTIVNSNVHLSCSYPGDGSLFVDDDGTGYFIYTAIDQEHAVRVERLAPDYLSSSGQTSAIFAHGAEAPLLFKRNQVYYVLCGPLCAFCHEGSDVLVFTSTSPLGPFNLAPNINRQMKYNISALWTQPIWAAGFPEAKYACSLTNHDASFPNNAPVIPAQETWVAKIPLSDGPIFIWVADLWKSAPDGVKGHDFQFWSSPLQFTNDTILPVARTARWNITWH